MNLWPLPRWLHGLLALLGLALTLVAPAHAGRSCEEKPPTTAQVEQGLRLAEATLRALDASGADVAVLARAGQDLSKYGLRWSHLGLAYRQDGVWRVVHKLNHCGTDEAAVYRQGLGEFFLDNPFRYEAAFVVLKPELQQALPGLIRTGRPLRLVLERDFAAIDIFMCGSCDPYEAVKTLKEALKPEYVQLNEARRGLVS